MNKFMIQKSLPFALLGTAVMLGNLMDADASVPSRLDQHMSASNPDLPRSEALHLKDIAADLASALPAAVPAYSEEWDMARSSSRPPRGLKCVSSSGAKACFQPYGDKIWVYDKKADGASAVAVWVTDYGRFGVCRNALSQGHWGVCNKNFKEGHVIGWSATQYDGDTSHFVGDVSRTERSRT